MKKYSRLASVEEKRNIKKAYYYIILSIATIVLLILYGLPALIKFAGFIGDVAKSDKPVEINDITPPAPPQFDQIVEFTNKEVLVITGKSESGATITIRANNENSEIVANSNGGFSFIFSLQAGDNTIDARSKDISGNESNQTNTYKIYFDNKEPKLDIQSPADGSAYFGSGQRQLSIKGTVDEIVDLTVNGKPVAIKEDTGTDGDNTFSFTTTLNEGENKFDVVATDPALNETSSTLTVNFSL